MTRFEKAMLVLGGMGAAATLAVMAVQHRLSPPRAEPVAVAGQRPCDQLDLRGYPFYAVGDGVVDDTAAVQAYINRAANCERTAAFPPGLYKINGTIDLPDGSHIFGGHFLGHGAGPVFRLRSP